MAILPCILLENTVYSFYDASNNFFPVHTLPLKVGFQCLDYAMGYYYALNVDGTVDKISETTLEIEESYPTSSSGSPRILRVSPNGTHMFVGGRLSGHSNNIYSLPSGVAGPSLGTHVGTSCVFTETTAYIEKAPSAIRYEINVYSLSENSEIDLLIFGILSSGSTNQNFRAAPLSITEDLRYLYGPITGTSWNTSYRFFVLDTTNNTTTIFATPAGPTTSSSKRELPIFHDGVFKVVGQLGIESVNINTPSTILTDNSVSHPMGQLRSLRGFNVGPLSITESASGTTTPFPVALKVFDYKNKKLFTHSARSVFVKHVPFKIEGNIKDSTGNFAQRRIALLHPETGQTLISTQSDPITGEYSLPTALNEVTRVIFSGESNRNDIVDRIVLT